MTRRPRITSLDQADAELASLSPWLTAAGQPNRQVRRLLDICAFYRGKVAEMGEGEEKGRWQKQEERRRK